MLRVQLPHQLHNRTTVKKYLVTLLALVSTAVSAQAIITRDQAQVVGVEPITEQVRQAGRCSQPNQYQQQEMNIGGAVLGTVIGGVIGSRFGGGHGREALIAAGAGAGALYGANQNNQQGYTGIQCEPDTVGHRIVGYRVTYEYQGYRATTITQYQPGQTVPVTITVAVENQQPQQYQQPRQNQAYPRSF